PVGVVSTFGDAINASGTARLVIDGHIVGEPSVNGGGIILKSGTPFVIVRGTVESSSGFAIWLTAGAGGTILMDEVTLIARTSANLTTGAIHFNGAVTTMVALRDATIYCESSGRPSISASSTGTVT